MDIFNDEKIEISFQNYWNNVETEKHYYDYIYEHYQQTGDAETIKNKQKYFLQQNYKCNKFVTLFKQQINTIKEDKWVFYKKYSNNFEMISNGNILRNSYICRSYFKLHEIIQDYDLKSRYEKGINVCCLCEAPGSFAQCLDNTFNCNKMFLNSLIVGNVLQNVEWEDDLNTEPQTYINSRDSMWKPFYKNVNMDNGRVQFLDGRDNTGNILDIQNIKHMAKQLYETCPEKCAIVTADGGIDFSNDYANLEKKFFNLFLAQVVLGLQCVQKGGTFIIKVFDCFQVYTLKTLYFLHLLFDEQHIVKPYSSRQASSEKYVVCISFKYENTQQFTNQIQKVFYQMYKVVQSNTNEIDNFNQCVYIKVSHYYIQQFVKFNITFTHNQIYNIIKIFDNYLKNRNSQNYEQIQHSLEWLNKYKIEYNLKKYVSRCLKYK